jgi:hypothetical protein
MMNTDDTDGNPGKNLPRKHGDTEEIDRIAMNAKITEIKIGTLTVIYADDRGSEGQVLALMNTDNSDRKRTT